MFEILMKVLLKAIEIQPVFSFKSRLSFILIFSFLFDFVLLAQTGPGRYWIQFKDKNYSFYTLDYPQQFLSQRSIQRRKDQKISFDITDLPVNPAYIDSIASTGAVIKNCSKWLNAVSIEVNDSYIINKIAALPFVEEVKKVQNVKSANKAEEQVFSFNSKAKLYCERGLDSSNYGNSYNQIKMLRGQTLHDAGYRGKGKMIAVLDAGFFGVDTIAAFDSLWNNGRIIGTKDYVSGDNMVFEDNNHGMYVLSVMGGYLPGELIGTAPEAAYLLLRTEDAGSENIIEEDNWIAAAEFADSMGVDIINSSLGYTTFDDSTQNHSYADMDGNTTPITIGADIAASKGILVVNSAGNSGASPWTYIAAPADGFNVLSVGAVNAEGNYSPFSSKGPSYDGRVKPNVMAQGQGTIIASASGGVFPGNGTSFSAPLIYGMAACLWQSNPEKTASEIFTAIEQSAHLFNHPDNLYGYGIPNFSIASLLISDTFVFNVPDNDKFLVYPNPFQSSINIEVYTKREQEMLIEIFDYSGKNIFQKELTVGNNDYCRISFKEGERLSPGIYFVHITAPGKTKSYKLVKF